MSPSALPVLPHLLVEKHYDKLVQLWCDPSTARSRYWVEDFVGVLLTKLWSGKTGLCAFEVTKAANAAAKRAQWNLLEFVDGSVYSSM